MIFAATNIPDGMSALLTILGVFMVATWILFPILVIVGLDRMTKILEQIRDGEHGLHAERPADVFPAPPPPQPSPQPLPKPAAPPTYRELYGGGSTRPH